MSYESQTGKNDGLAFQAYEFDTELAKPAGEAQYEHRYQEPISKPL
jgi:hypothetical protein